MQIGSLLRQVIPAFKFNFRIYRSAPDELLLVLPFRRPWKIIAFVAVFFLVVSLPLVSVGSTLDWNSDGSLFGLLFNLFSLFWMLGWSTAVVALGAVLLVLSLGREVLYARRDCMLLRIEVLGLGIEARYPAKGIRQFALESAAERTGTEWRGDHLKFQFASDTIGFGSNLSATEAREILSRLSSLYPQQNKEAPAINSVKSSRAKEPAGHSRLHDAGHDLANHIETSQGSSSWLTLSSLSLLFANLFPLYAVLFLDWMVFDLMFLFWAESAVIGFYNLLKMWKINGIASLFYGLFFTGHFGGFMAVHLLFIYAFFSADMAAGMDATTTDVLADVIKLAPVLLGFVISHGVSHFSNFLGRKEYLGRSMSQQMHAPYRRIIIMHLTILLGGFVAMMLQNAVPALLFLVIAKAAMDLRAHQAEHANTR